VCRSESRLAPTSTTIPRDKRFQRSRGAGSALRSFSGGKGPKSRPGTSRDSRSKMLVHLATMIKGGRFRMPTNSVGRVRVIRNCPVMALVASSCFGDGVQAKELEEVVVADELRIAFYEHAPRSFAKAVSKAVASWCSSDRSDHTVGVASWLCEQDKQA